LRICGCDTTERREKDTERRDTTERIEKDTDMRDTTEKREKTHNRYNRENK
jgi:hypothetical protein